MTETPFDLVIRNGSVVTASDLFKADIGVRDGVIDTIGRALREGRRDIDATGCFVLPGGVDTHCHIEQMTAAGVKNADTFESATRSAAHGGTTTVIPFAAQQRGEDLWQTVRNYHELANRGALVDYAFHMILTNPDSKTLEQDLPRLIAEGHSSIKLFMTYDRLFVDDERILDIMMVARRFGAMICVHAENHGMIAWSAKKLLNAGLAAPKYQADAHSRLAEAEAITRLIALSQLVDQPVTIFHVSSAEGLAVVREARARGVKIFAETCPQYLFLTAADMDHPGQEGAKWMCSPPLRSTADQAALWEGLRQGTLQMVSSDHAPFRFDSSGKLSAGENASFKQMANGLPGLESRMLLMVDKALRGEELDLCKLVDVTATTPARTYNLYPRKGTIAIGSDADLVVWNPDHPKLLTDEDVHDRTGYTPYAKQTVCATPDIVTVRGEIVVEYGQSRAQPGFGLFLARSGGPAAAPSGTSPYDITPLIGGL